MLVAAKAQVLEDVVNNIRSGNLPAITKYFDKTVAISINNNQSTYSGAQAEMVLKDFYSKNPVKDFVIMQCKTPISAAYIESHVSAASLLNL